MSLLTANDIPVARAEIAIPRVGRGAASVILASERGPASGEAVTLLSQDGQTMRYTCVTGQRASGWWHMGLVAGAGKLNKSLPNRYYEGIPAATVARDILNEAGETPGPIDLPGTLTRYVRRAAPAYQQLAALLAGYDRAWRILPDGSIWIGQDSGATAGPVSVSEAYPSDRRYVLGLDLTLTPGVVVRGILDGQEATLGRVERIRHCVGPRLRTEVYCAN